MKDKTNVATSTTPLNMINVNPGDEMELKIAVNKEKESVSFSIWNHQVLVAEGASHSPYLTSILKFTIFKPSANSQKEITKKYGIKASIGFMSGFWEKETKEK